MAEKERIEIDLSAVAAAIAGKWRLVAAACVVCAVLVLAVTAVFITPKYQSSAIFYVNNSSPSPGDTARSITSSDISASRGLVQSYIVILNTRESLNEVIDYTGIDRTDQELKEMITAEAVDNTEFFKVVVTAEDATEAEKIANGIAWVLPNRIAGIIEGTSAKIVDSPVAPAKPSSPSYVKSAVVGILLGFVLSVGGIALRVAFDVTIRRQEELAQCCKYPVLAAVPTGEGITPADSEAYKLLRTKLQFSFDDQMKSRVIGVSSSLHGEGKSANAMNLALSLSRLGKKVVLVDCDMRHPAMMDQLGVRKKPGMSGFLTGQITMGELLQHCTIKGSGEAFYVIAAGHNPSSSVELLSSERMSKMMICLREFFDYVILDLPPVTELSDTLAASKETDGILLAVRQDYSNRNALKDAVCQFEFVGVRLLGIVYNEAKADGAQKSRSGSIKRKKTKAGKEGNAEKKK